MQQKHKSTISVILMTLSAALGSFYFGYSLSILNFSQATINVVFGIPPLKQSYVSGLMGSFVPVGAFVGTIISSFLMARFSRRQAFIVVDLFGCLGWILSATVINVPAFIFFRFLIGVATGLNSNIVPLYINEISPVKISGLTGCLNGVMIGFG
jgi:MFS family permease